MKSTQLITFENNELGEIKGFLKNGEPWFLSGQVCRALGLKDAGRQIKAIEERFRIAEIKGTHSMRPLIDTNGGKQNVLCISESILYELIFQSRKKKAIKFRAWITTEVLPSIRKYGEYRTGGKIIRQSLTDALQDSGENERMHGHGFSTYTRLIYKSLGLPNKIDRDSIDPELLEKIARKENVVSAMINDGKQYNDIKGFILEETK